MARIILDLGSGNTCRNDIKYIKRMYDELKAIDTGRHEVIVKWQLFEKAGDNVPLLPESFEYAYEYGTKLGYQVTASVFDKNSLDFLLNFDIPFVKIANRRELDWLIGEVPRKMSIIVSCDEILNMTRLEYERRFVKKWTQTELAEKCGRMNMSDISRYERRKMEPYTGHAVKMSRVLGIPVDELAKNMIIRTINYHDNIIFMACVSKYPAKCDDYINTFSNKQLHLGISDHTADFELFNAVKPSLVEWHYKLSDSTGLDAGPFARTPEQLAEVL